MRKIILVLALLFILASCKNKAIERTVTTINGIDVELLFEVDGCKVYRFLDCGMYIYFSDCRGKIEYNYSSGKTSNKRQIINE